MYKHIELNTEDLRTIIADYCHCNDSSEVTIEINDSEMKATVDFKKDLINS